ncbi:DUF1559 domain-containing protein, partial [Alienimonas sp. DA493]|uniref:DUF1559 family PulG-like putative transporter n=1 Tax=Alienimonas sp. DA493 TaxID=3373605 RepID=UPI0037552DCD
LECQNNVKNITLALTNKATGDSGKLPHIRDGVFRLQDGSPEGTALNTWPRAILPQMDARPQDRALSSLEELHLNATDASAFATRFDALNLGDGQIQSYVCPDDSANDIKSFGLSYRVNAGYIAASLVPGAGEALDPAAESTHVPGAYDWRVAGTNPTDDAGVQLKSGAMHNPINGDLNARNGAGAVIGAPAQLTLDQIGNWDGTTNTLWVSENNTAANWFDDNTFGLAFGALVLDDSRVMDFPTADPDTTANFSEKGKPNLQFNDGITRPVPMSEHSGGAIAVGFCDGRAATISDSISRSVYLRLISSGGSRLSYPRTDAVPAALRGAPLQAPVSSSDFD